MTTPAPLLLAAILGITVATAAFAQPPMDVSPAEMLKRADTDGDGKVNRDEFIKARTARLGEMFDRMDTSGDGALDEQEAEAAAEQIRAMMAGGRGGLRRPDGQRPPRTGGDAPQRPAGERPTGERPAAGAMGEQAFDRFDGDGDGKLTREEFAAGMAMLREFMQRTGQGPGGAARPEGGGRGPAEGFRKPPQQD